MTREESKEHIRRYSNGLWGMVKIEHIDKVLDQIYNDHETAIEILMKANEEEISRHFNECEKYEAQLKAKDEEIERLKADLNHLLKELGGKYNEDEMLKDNL